MKTKIGAAAVAVVNATTLLALSACGGGGEVDMAKVNGVQPDVRRQAQAVSVSANDIVIRAKGQLESNVGPRMSVRVNGVLVGAPIEVRASTYQDFIVTSASAIPGGAKVEVVFDNDAYTNSGDRNLFVESITANGSTIRATDSGVTYVVLGSQKVNPGKSEMWSNGTLTFILPSLVVTDMLTARSQPGCVDASDTPNQQTKDFIDKVEKQFRLVMPRDCRVVMDNPVAFFWPEPNDASRDINKPWTLKVYDSANQVAAQATSIGARLLLNTPLPVGKSYTWTVAYTDKQGVERTSRARRFDVPQAVNNSPIDDADAVLKTLASRSGRSDARVLPNGKTFADVRQVIESNADNPYNKSFANLVSVNTPVNALTQALDTKNHPLPNEPLSRDDTYLEKSNEYGYLEVLGFRWRFTGDAQALKVAKDRLLRLASFGSNINSLTTYAANETIARQVMYALALGYDLIGDQLTPAERSAVEKAVLTRINDAVVKVGNLNHNGYDGYGNTSLHFATQSVLLMAQRPELETATRDKLASHLKTLWPLMVVQPGNRGEEDGGYDGSVAYAWWDLVPLAQTLAIVNLTTGIDLSKRSYIKNLGDYLLAMTAPKTSQFNAFGDGAESQALFTNYSYKDYRLYAAVTRQPQQEWYWKNTTTSDGVSGYISPLHYMLSGRNLPAVVPVKPTVNNRVFADVGVVAMHDDIASPTRSSVFFRANRTGNYNHAHADQNAFTYTAQGKNLLINSGYYTSYGNEAHIQVTRKTRYKNAITLDGGMGQAEDASTGLNVSNSMDASGALTSVLFSPSVSVTTGDATLAYRRWIAGSGWSPLLSGAYRSVAYFKDDKVVVVYDWLSSDTARQWEWNYHGVLGSLGESAFVRKGDALLPGNASGNESIEVRNGNVKACIYHYGPQGKVTVDDTFPVMPKDKQGNILPNYPNQSHARFTVNQPSKQVTAVTVIVEDCAADRGVSVSWPNPGLGLTATEVRVGQHAIALNGKTAKVLR